MILSFKVHLDDYHSTITANWRGVYAAIAHVQEEIDGGYDVTDITLDDRPLFCTKCGNGREVPAEIAPYGGAVEGLCITHRHQAYYDRHSAAGRYQGD